MIKQPLTEISKIHSKLSSYWPQFIASPYAYYDRESVYLFHHPHFENRLVTIPWNGQFTGSTSIIYENEETAIVDTNNMSNEEIYATLIHELFHCHQYHMNEQRFPNELVGMSYPLEHLNIKWRILERQWLNKALQTDHITEQEIAIQSFIYWREKRNEIYNEVVNYENRMETIEGPAFFIEYNAYKEITKQTRGETLQHYIHSLTDDKTTINKIRHSCYTSGLAICLLLDAISPNWKSELFNHQLTIFEVLKQQMSPMPSIPEDIPLPNPIEQYILEAEMGKQHEIHSFKETQGYLITLKGKGKIKQFDPMNITKWQQSYLHKNGLTLFIQGRTIYFTQPVLAMTAEGLTDVVELQFFLDYIPEITADGMVLKEKGHLQGTVVKGHSNLQLMI